MSAGPAESLLDPVRAAHREIVAEWTAFTPADFDRPSACPGWAVRDVITHLRLLASRFPTALARGLRGEVTPLWLFPLPGEDYAAADRREFAETRARPGSALATEFAALSAVLTEFFDRIPPADQEASVGTPRGVFKARHVPYFYIYELGIHDWDIQAAFDPAAGIRPSLSRAFARVLRSRLPVLVQPSSEPIDRFRIRVGAPVDRIWAIERMGNRYQVSDRPNGAADLETDLSTLAIVTSGRLSGDAAIDQGRWQAADRDLARRFGQLFAGPV